jgi:hypothetical protein
MEGMTFIDDTFFGKIVGMAFEHELVMDTRLKWISFVFLHPILRMKYHATACCWKVEQVQSFC